MKKSIQQPAFAPNNQEPAVVPLKPATAQDWHVKLVSLHADLEQVNAAHGAKIAERKSAAGQLLLGIGSSGEQVARLEAEERELEHRVDAIQSAIGFAEAEAGRLDAEARRARLEAQRQRREAVATEILDHARSLDELFAEAGERLEAIDKLLKQYRIEGGVFSRSFKGCVTRAVLATRMRPYVATEFVGERQHLLPLAEQFGALITGPGLDSEIAEEASARIAESAQPV